MSTNAISRSPATISQACAVPFRTRSGRMEFCLITSSAGRWLFPKGVVDPGETHAETALKEAREEAGLHGRIVGEPLGYYQIEKNGGRLNVVSLAMQVDRVDKTWDEAATRERRWVSPRRARGLLSGSAELLALLEEAIRRHAQ